LKQKPFEKVRRVKEKRDGMEEMSFRWWQPEKNVERRWVSGGDAGGSTTGARRFHRRFKSFVLVAAIHFDPEGTFAST
jgi:hypothetical protein